MENRLQLSINLLQCVSMHHLLTHQLFTPWWIKGYGSEPRLSACLVGEIQLMGWILHECQAVTILPMSQLLITPS